MSRLDAHFCHLRDAQDLFPEDDSLWYVNLLIASTCT